MSITISGHTGLLALLGSPVAHSISPLMHNESFRLLELDYVYLCFDVTPEGLKTAVEGLKSIGTAGFNLTMPHKTAMCSLADELTPAARMINAVNTVIHTDGKLIGHNTDGTGYLQSVRAAGHDITGKKMTLLGAGGAATAIFVQAALDGAAEIDIFSRKSPSFLRTEALVETVNRTTSCKARIFELEDKVQLNQSIGESYLLTNATPLGMSPKEDTCPIQDCSVFREDLIVSDIIYNPRETLFLKYAKERGCKTFNGLYMLLYQGAKAFEIWTGKEMPVNIIKEKYFD